MAIEPFILSIEPVTGTVFQYGFHLGTDETVARSIAEEKFHARNLSPLKNDQHGNSMATRTVALIQCGKLIAVYDGAEWRKHRSTV